MAGSRHDPRGAAIVIAVATTSITVGAGLLMTVVDGANFPSLGGGLWWAIQTVTTVGYGDHVPNTAAGRIVAALVMLLGIGFITVITASITSTFAWNTHADKSSTAARTPWRLRSNCRTPSRESTLASSGSKPR